MSNERIEILEAAIMEAKRSHTWLLKSIKHQADDLKGEGNYSPELEHSISVQELLEHLT